MTIAVPVLMMGGRPVRGSSTRILTDEVFANKGSPRQIGGKTLVIGFERVHPNGKELPRSQPLGKKIRAMCLKQRILPRVFHDCLNTSLLHPQRKLPVQEISYLI